MSAAVDGGNKQLPKGVFNKIQTQIEDRQSDPKSATNVTQGCYPLCLKKTNDIAGNTDATDMDVDVKVMQINRSAIKR